MNKLSIIDRVSTLLHDKKIKQKQLAASIGVNAPTLNGWINNGIDFPSSYIIPISRFFDVHPIWLLTGEDALMPEIPDTYVELSPDERFLIDTYRQLDPEGRVMTSGKAVEELRRLKESVPAESTATA